MLVLPQAASARVVVWAVDASSALHGTVRAGDVVRSWETDGGVKAVETPIDWLWFLEEWRPRRATRITMSRAGRSLGVTVPPAGRFFRAGPEIAPELRRDVEAVLNRGPPAGQEKTAARIDAIQRKLEATPDVLFWFQLSLAGKFLEEGDVDQALAVVERAADTAHRVEDPRAELLVLHLRSAALLRAGRREDAVAVNHRIVKLSGAHPGLMAAAAHHDLGVAFKGMGKLQQAAREFTTAASMKRALAGGSLTEAVTLQELGKALLNLGELERARKAIEDAVAIAVRTAPASIQAAEVYNALGNLEFTAGRLDAAEAAYRRSLEIRQRLSGRPGAYKALYNLALVAYQQRRLATASSLLDEAQDLLEEEPGPGRQARAMILNARLNLAMERGDFALAERLGKQALQLARQAEPVSLNAASYLVNLGAIASRQGDATTARSYYLRALDILRRIAPDGPDLPVVLADLGDLALSEGRYDRARDRFREVLGLLEKRGGQPLHCAQIRQNLAYAAWKSGNPLEAERECRAALRIQGSVAPRSRDEAVSLSLLARILESRDPEAASSLHLRSITILRETAPGTVFLAEAYHACGRFELRRGRREDALTSYTRAIAALEEQMERLGATESVRSAFRGRYAAWYRELEDLLVESGRPEQALEVLERSRARSLLAMLSARELELGSPAVRKLDLERRMLSARYDTLLERLARASAETRSRLRSQLEAVRRRQDRLREEIRAASPRLASIRYPSPVGFEEAVRAVGSRTAVLAYSVGNDHTLLLALVPGEGVLARRIPVGREELARMVELFRGLILGKPGESGRREAFRGAAAALSGLLLDPVRTLPPEVDTLILLPEGPLAVLPFSALLVPGDGEGRFLCERFAIAVEPSLTVLERLRQRRETVPVSVPGQLLAVANPGSGERVAAAAGVLRGGSLEELPPLPGTLEEVREITALWQGESQALLGREASEKRVFSLAPEAGVLHIASHVLLDDRHPLDSAIVLEPSPGAGGGNGLLQAWEIMQSLRLPGSLVVLSGCETGLGQEWEGEGVVGLTRAFHYSGARTVVSSLWRVDDEGTILLMKRFYAHVGAGLRVAEALRRARVELLRRSRPGEGLWLRVLRFLGLAPSRPVPAPDDPAIWAAFQVHGDPSLCLPQR